MYEVLQGGYGVDQTGAVLQLSYPQLLFDGGIIVGGKFHQHLESGGEAANITIRISG